MYYNKLDSRLSTQLMPIQMKFINGRSAYKKVTTQNIQIFRYLK